MQCEAFSLVRPARLSSAAWPLLVLSLVLMSGAVEADRVDDYVRRELKRQQIPGLALAVLKNGKVVKAAGYGFADAELSVPVTEKTLFDVGSISKQFTAAAILLLAQRGKLKLDDPVRNYLEAAPDSWSAITLRHLLTHTSGLDVQDYESLDEHEDLLRRDYSEAEMLAWAAHVPLAAAPGERWAYSNMGYVLLGMVIRKVSGQFHGDFLRGSLFGPLEMTTARVRDHRAIISNRASGYNLTAGVLQNERWFAPSWNRTADGGLLFSVTDLAKWDTALQFGRVLDQSSIQQMYTPAKLNNGAEAVTFLGSQYGFGWFLDKYLGHRLFHHRGTWLGFRCHIARFVDDGLTVIVLTNLGDSAPDQIGRSIAGLYVRELAPQKKEGSP
jgi:CubicO group peptidase (beta-lactamase class C family)